MPKRILVADDDRRISELLKVLLEDSGYTVVQAYDGEEALEAVSRSKPDLMILDVSMPRLDGDQVYMTLHSTPETKTLPILMLTGLRSEEEIAAEKDENMFAKPVRFEPLLARIRQLIGE